MKITGLLLAGGESRRMGTNKALLPMSEGTSIQNIARELKKVAESVLLVTNTPGEYEFLHLPSIKDSFIGLGPLAGLHAGLAAATTDVVVVAACDMPFIKSAIIEEMVENLGEYDAVVPEIDGQLHPLFAVYRKACLPSIISCLEMKQLKMINFLDKIDVHTLKDSDFRLKRETPDLFSYMFYNMNKPEEYKEARFIEEKLDS
jgi:molybdenum cofactor guanylyltransferase